MTTIVASPLALAQTATCFNKHVVKERKHVMSDGFVMSARQAAELDHAFERNGWTPADVKLLSGGDMLIQILPVLRGRVNIIVGKHIVDCDTDPFVSNGWVVEGHIKGGQFEFEPKKISLYLDEAQQNGGMIVGNKLREKLKGKSVLNANVLDYLLAHPELIPHEWKEKLVFFWGTIYREDSVAYYSDGSLYVRCLRWDHGSWFWGYDWLQNDFCGDYPSAVLASN